MLTFPTSVSIGSFHYKHVAMLIKIQVLSGKIISGASWRSTCIVDASLESGFTT